MKLIALVDCNSFYCSCEQVFRPDLIKKPVVVLSNNDGCVIARSNEAKGLGIPMGAPYHHYKKLIQFHGVSVFSANFPLYADLSSRIMNILHRFSDSVEVYSIDEAFISLDGLTKDTIAYAKTLRATILQWTGIPVSIGIAPSKVLAKCANRFAKLFPECDGVFSLIGEDMINSALKQTPIEDIWGVGRQNATKCKQRQINTAYDLKVYPNRNTLLKLLTKTGLQIHDELNQISCIDITSNIEPRKNIQSSRSFQPELNDLNDIAAAVSMFTTRAMEKLRAQHSLTQMITVFIRTNPFQNIPQYRNARTISLDTATNNTILVIKVARHILESIYIPGITIKKAGIILSEISDDSSLQQSLFSQVNNHSKLMSVMDQLNHRYGRDMVSIANNLRFKNKKMPRKWLSNQYTTNWSEILTV
ncbi:MAG: Y-family DNA polymerase [Candidatus Margulisiibacteriota bacterium]